MDEVIASCPGVQVSLTVVGAVVMTLWGIRIVGWGWDGVLLLEGGAVFNSECYYAGWRGCRGVGYCISISTI